MNPPQPFIDLNAFEGLGLIIRWPSGVFYTNQTAGLACEHPSLEGVMVPLFDGTGHPVMHSLRQHFRGDWHSIVGRDADIVDGILRRNHLGHIRCDRGRLEDSREAWIHVIVSDDCAAARVPALHGFGSRHAVLTWPNSD